VDVFNQYDVDHDGRLSLDEIKGMVVLEFLPQATQQELSYFVVRHPGVHLHARVEVIGRMLLSCEPHAHYMH
jgi:hypothetical protein